MCGGKLRIDIYESSTEEEIVGGLLLCKCNGMYPIFNGVPRLLLPEVGIPREFMEKYELKLKQNNVAFARIKETDRFSFTMQWDMYNYGELSWEIDLSERIDFLYHYLNSRKTDLNGAVMLDAGCGNGTLTAAIAKEGARIVGMDFSNSIELAEKNKKKYSGENWRNLHYVQGDVQHPPFAESTFDVVYSDGVLHHTNDTKKSFCALAPLVKPKGKYFVWLYKKDLKGIYKTKEVFVQIIRSVLRPLPKWMIKKLCYVGAVVLIARLRILKIVGIEKRRIIPAWLKTLNLFDTFTPTYNHLHTVDEVIPWYQEMGFKNIEQRTAQKIGHAGFGVLGIKPESWGA